MNHHLARRDIETKESKTLTHRQMCRREDSRLASSGINSRSSTKKLLTKDVLQSRLVQSDTLGRPWEQGHWHCSKDDTSKRYTPAIKKGGRQISFGLTHPLVPSAWSLLAHRLGNTLRGSKHPLWRPACAGFLVSCRTYHSWHERYVSGSNSSPHKSSPRP
jgi:hypothetical protein